MTESTRSVNGNTKALLFSFFATGSSTSRDAIDDADSVGKHPDAPGSLDDKAGGGESEELVNPIRPARRFREDKDFFPLPEPSDSVPKEDRTAPAGRSEILETGSNNRVRSTCSDTPPARSAAVSIPRHWHPPLVSYDESTKELTHRCRRSGRLLHPGIAGGPAFCNSPQTDGATSEGVTGAMAKKLSEAMFGGTTAVEDDTASDETCGFAYAKSVCC